MAGISLLLGAVFLLVAVPVILGEVLACRTKTFNFGWIVGPGLGIGAILVVGVVMAASETVLFGRPQVDRDNATRLEYEIDGPLSDVKRLELIRAIHERIDPTARLPIEVEISEDGTRVFVWMDNSIVEEQTSEAKVNIDETSRKIARAGTLEFRVLARQTDPMTIGAIGRAKETPDQVVVDEAGEPIARWVTVSQERWAVFAHPDGTPIGAPYQDAVMRVTSQGDEEVLEVLVLDDPFDVSGKYLESTSVGFSHGHPSIDFIFNNEGARRFKGLTSANLDKPLGIVLNGKLYSAPNIRAAISKRGEITGNFTRQEAQDLVDILNAGALPAALFQEPISVIRTSNE